MVDPVAAERAVAGTPRLLRVGEVAALAGVSVQTVRLWERQQLLAPTRTPGGQRLFTSADAERARRIVALRRRHGWNPAAIRHALGDEHAPTAHEGAAEGVYGPRIRTARHERGMTLQETAERAGISRSTLSAVELGQRAVTPQMLSAIADALGMSVAAFAADPNASRVVRVADRPRTSMAGGVRWEELATAGHTLEPAMLIVPPGASSGGDYARPGEVFITMLHGTLTISVGGAEAEQLREGDSILIEPNVAWRWTNTTRRTARALYVELVVRREPAT